MNRHGHSRPTLQDIRATHGWKQAYERYLPLSRYFFRPLGFWVTWAVVRWGGTSEGVSWLSGLVGLSGCALLVSGSQPLLPVGIGLLFLFNLLDCVDGSIARTMKTQNPYGRFLDSVCGGVIDLAFWGVVGIMAFQHSSLLRWAQPFGYGATFWLAIGGATCFLSVWLSYLEMCFDTLVRPAWDGLRMTANPPPAAPLKTTQPPAEWLQTIMTNLRVRETHYCLLLVAYATASVDLLLTAYFVYFSVYTVLLTLVYAKRGRQVKARSGVEWEHS